MSDTRLISGPYSMPRLRVGAKVYCLYRGDVRVISISDAPIPWPISSGMRQKPIPILTGSLVAAVMVESVESISYHWGVSRSTVRRWRYLLGVARFNPGTVAAWRRVAMTKLVHARACRTFAARRPIN